MKRLTLGLSMAVLGLCLTTASVRADDKTYQVTGPVLEVTPTTITVKKGNDNWEIGRDANTKVKRLLCTEPHPFGLQLAQAPQHGDGHAHAGPRILLHALRFGIAEEHHDGITDIFVDGSAVLERDIRGSVT